MDRNIFVPCWNTPPYLYKINLAPKQFWRTYSSYNIYWICHSSHCYFIFHHSAVLCTHVLEKGDVEKMMTEILWDGWICLSLFCPHDGKQIFFLTLFSSSVWSIRSSLVSSRKAAWCHCWGAENSTGCSVSGLDLLIFCAQEFMRLNTPDVHLWKSFRGKKIHLFHQENALDLTCICSKLSAVHIWYLHFIQVRLFKAVFQKAEIPGVVLQDWGFEAQGGKCLLLQSDISVGISIFPFLVQHLLLITLVKTDCTSHLAQRQKAISTKMVADFSTPLPPLSCSGF